MCDNHDRTGMQGLQEARKGEHLHSLQVHGLDKNLEGCSCGSGCERQRSCEGDVHNSPGKIRDKSQVMIE